MGNMDHLETLKNEVFRKLADLDLEELTEVTEQLKLNVPLSRQGKQSSVMRTIAQHLMSDDVQDDDNGGLDVFQQTLAVMDTLLAGRSKTVNTGEVKDEVAADSGGLGNMNGAGSSSGPTVPAQPPLSMAPGASHASSIATAAVPLTTTTTTTSTAPIDQLAAMLLQQLTNSVRTSAVGQQAAVKTEVRRLTDFKINGVVGNGEGQLDYAALMYRIRDGKSKGYKPAEIISGVVAAMKPGSELRKLFESIPEIDEDKFNQLLKGHYDIQSATNILTDLTSCGQEPTQGVREYVAKMIRLKNTLTIVAEEENFMNSDMIYETFINSVSVGLRNTAIRLELQPILLRKLPDEDLSYEVNKIVMRDQKHRKMMGEKGVKAGANLLDVEEINLAAQKNTGVTKEDIILEKLDSLGADMKTLATVKEDVKVLGGRMDVHDKRLTAIEKKLGAANAANGDADTNPHKNKRFVKCEACEREKKWCNHCNKCGESGHKRKDCPKN